MGKRNELVDLTLVHFYTSKQGAYLVGNTGDRDKAVWLAPSLTEVGDKIIGYEDESIGGLRTKRTYPIYEFTIPQWLAEERGLV